jgi:hypothetical protein
MSTFTRLYFVNRGPSIAEHDTSERLDAPTEEVGSPDLAPADPAADSDQDSDWGRLRHLSLSHLPRTSPEQDSRLPSRWPPGRTTTSRDPGAPNDTDFET